MLEPIFKAQAIIDEKEDYIKQQSSKADDISQEHHLSKVAVWKYKDYSYYKGRGWTKSSITKPDPDEKFKDRVSPCFRKLLDIVNTCKHVGDLSILDDYLHDMEAAGIRITIDTSDVNNVDQESFQQGISEMCKLQKGVCESADAIRDIGPEAEKANLCKSARFKKLAEQYHKLSSCCGEDKKENVRDEMKDEIVANLLNNRGISTILGDRPAESLAVDIDTGEVISK